MSISPTNPIDQLSEFDARRARDATGVLAELNAAGVLHAGDVHLAQTLAKSTEPSPARPMEQRELVELAIALTARGLREGSICVDLEVEVEALAESHPIGWPDSQEWLKVLQSDEVTRAGALVIDDGLVYLQRFHHQEVSLAESLAHRAALPPLPFDAEALGEAAAWVFPPDASYDAQRNAALTAVAARTSVLTGGPGTGKTTAIAGLLALLWINAQGGPGATDAAESSPRRLRIALAAPTAKAALRLEEAIHAEVAGIVERARQHAPNLVEVTQKVESVKASTLHRLLGSSASYRAPNFHRDRRVPYDVIIVDEASMMPLSMAAQLVAATADDTRLLIVGDPDQLVSVEAGAVLSDLVRGLTTGQAGIPVTTLSQTHRFDSQIGDLAGAVKRGDAAQAVDLLANPTGERITFLKTETDSPPAALRRSLTQHAVRLHRAAAASEPTRALEILNEHRLLCAHREGPAGVAAWNRQIERWLAEHTGQPLWEANYVGRPIMVTKNDHGLELYNGDTGVLVLDGNDVQAAFPATGNSPEPRIVSLSQLSAFETVHASTIHKAQGSQAQSVTVILPDKDSALLTRELIYTAMTRAQSHLNIVGTPEIFAAGVQRQVRRASGLVARLS